MKRLIEKGIGIMLWCLQMVMLGVTVVATTYFSCHYIQNTHAELIDWLEKAQEIRSSEFLHLENSIHVPFTSAWWGGHIIETILLIMVGVTLGGIFSMVITNFFRHSANLLESEIRMRYNKSPYGYGYAAEDVVHSAFREFMNKSSVTSLAGDYLSSCGYRLEYMLTSWSLAVSVSRSSRDDIEKKRSEAECEMIAYHTNKDKAETKFKKSRSKKLSATPFDLSKSIFLAVSTYFRPPIVQMFFPLFGVPYWVFKHWFIIAGTVLAFSDIGSLAISLSENYESFLLSSTSFVACLMFLFLSWMKWKKQKSTCEEEECYSEEEHPSYKKSASDFVDYYDFRYCLITGISDTYHILDIFQAFLDLHKDGWRMKIFPFSRERIHEEKRLAQERGEEIVIFPDVDEIDARLAEEERREQMIASIGDV